jgi:hypothetical protein
MVTFIDWGYKAIDGTRQFIKNIGGESWAQNFDKFAGAVDNVISVAMIAALATADSGGGGGDDLLDMGGDFFRKKGAQKVAQTAGQKVAGKAAGAAKLGTGAVAGIVAGAGLLASALGEGAFQLRKIATKPLQDTKREFDKLNWFNPKKYFVGAQLAGMSMLLGPLSALGVLLDVVGAPFRYAIELLRFPFLSEEDKKKQAHNLSKFDARIREDFRKALNLVTLGFAFKEKGSFGNIYGNKGAQNQMMGKMAGGGKPTTRGGRLVSGPARRTLKKKKKTRTLSFTPRKIKPGASVGGEEKVRSVFPNPEKAWWNPFGLFAGKQPEEKPEKPKGKQTNPQEFLVDSNDTLGRSNFFGPFFTLAIKSVLGQKPDQLDYKNAGKGLNSWVNTTFKSGTFGFAGGGEVDASEFLSGEDYTNVIAKSVEDSVSKEVETTIRNLSRELSLRPVGKEEMIQQNNNGGPAINPDATIPDDGGGGGYDDSPHGTPGPAVKTTKGFNAGKGDKSRKIFLHWTASGYNSNFNNYHTTFLSDGTAIRNTKDYGIDKTEHTAGANTNSVGLSIAAMGKTNGREATPSYFGRFPPTSAQVSAMALESARLAVSWGWDESTIDKNVMTHGEWERYATSTGKLPGRPQRWDLDKLRQGDKMNSGGDKLRKMIKSYFRKLKSGTTTDASGTTKVTSTGAPIAQMSLESAMEMMQPGTGSAGRVSGGTADFWALAAISALEGINAQGEADVAQSIYNRAAAGIFPGGKSIHAIITKDPKQYSPVKESNPALWAAIKDKESAIKAVASHKNGRTNAAKKVEESAKNIKNPALQSEALKFVGGRTDFEALSVYPRPSKSDAISLVQRHGHRFGFWVGPGSKKYGQSNPRAAGVPSLGATVAAGNTGTTPVGQLRGGDGRFIQGNSGRSGGVHFHIGTNKPGDASGSTAAGFNVIKHFLGKKSIHVGRSWENIPSNATDEQIRGYIARGQAAHATKGRGRTELDLQIGGRDGRKNNVPFPLALKNMNYSATDGYGVSADIVGTNAFVGHGRYKSDGSLALQQGTPSQGPLSSGAPDFYAFHGMNKLMTRDALIKVHKGEYVSVTDKDTVELSGSIISDLNSIENKSQLVAKAPSIIEKLKAISGYTDYERQEPEVHYIEVPVEVPVPMPMGGGGLMMAGGGGIDNTYDTLEML